MSAAALAQRLRNGFVPGLNQEERNGWNGRTQPVPFQPKQAVPSREPDVKQWVTDDGKHDGTGGTGGTGVFVGVGKQDTESRPKQAANDPAPAHGAPVLADWRQADAEYLRHHWTCPSCCAAGHGRGQRCTTGAELWSRYEAAWSAAQPSNTLSRRIGK